MRTLVLAALLAAAGPAPAQTCIWTGTAADGNWTTAGNWSTSPYSAASPDVVLPTGVTQRTTTLDQSLTINSLTIGGSNYSVANSNSAVLTLGAAAGGGNIVANAGVTGVTISAPITLGVPAGNRQFFTVNAGAVMNIGGPLAGTTGAELAKEGTGTLVLSGNNSGFTGPISVDNNAGTLRLGSPSALGSTSAGTIVGTNATLDLNGQSGVAEALTLNGPGAATNGALTNSSVTAAGVSGAIQLASDTSIGGAGGIMLSGPVGDSGSGHGLTKVGAGPLTLGNPAGNTYRGPTIITAGTLVAANTSGSATGPGGQTAPITVASGGTLAGGNGGGSANPFADSTQGFIAGPVTVQAGGILAPGSSVGLLTVSNTVTFQSGSTFAVELGSNVPEPGNFAFVDNNSNDRLHTPLDLVLGSTLTVAIDGLGQSFTPGLTYGYFLARADGSIGSLPATVTIVPSNFASGANPGDFTLGRSADLHTLFLAYTPTPVPEPGTLALTGVGLVAAWRIRRRRTA